MKKVRVDASRVYDVIIENGILARAGELSCEIIKPCRAVILTDDTVGALYADRLARTKKQCKDRADDIREQARLIFALKAQIENESSALRELIG